MFPPLSHSCPYLATPMPLLSHPCPCLATHAPIQPPMPLLSHPCPYLANHAPDQPPMPLLSHPNATTQPPMLLLSQPCPYLATHAPAQPQSSCLATHPPLPMPKTVYLCCNLGFNFKKRTTVRFQETGLCVRQGGAVGRQEGRLENGTVKQVESTNTQVNKVQLFGLELVQCLYCWWRVLIHK